MPLNFIRFHPNNKNTSCNSITHIGIKTHTQWCCILLTFFPVIDLAFLFFIKNWFFFPLGFAFALSFSLFLSLTLKSINITLFTPTGTQLISVLTCGMQTARTHIMTQSVTNDLSSFYLFWIHTAFTAHCEAVTWLMINSPPCTCVKNCSQIWTEGDGKNAGFYFQPRILLFCGSRDVWA